jgi:prevent-host-death family protein
MSALPDIVPITDLRQDAAGVIKRTADSEAPVFITQRGRAAAVMVSAKAYQRTQHELEILRALARGEAEIEVGVGYDLDAVMAEADKLLGSA